MERYWCNFSKDLMKKLNIDAHSNGWKDAIKKNISGNVLDHISARNRVDFRFVLPDLKDKLVLDVGSMWGGISVPISDYAKEVYSVDTTFETLELLKIRAEQENVNNLNIALSSARNLPFSDNYFDVVLLIGVLEWLGADYDFVASEHYGKRSKDRAVAIKKPTELQLEALSEIQRVLKPGGKVLIAIENRYFYKYFFGYPDPHTAVPFSSILPRFLANKYMNLFKNKNYQEYTYSIFGYKKLLKKSNFKKFDFYASSPSYREPEVILPLNNPRYIRYFYENFGLRDLKGIKKFIPWILIKLNLMKYLVHSYLIVAEK